MSTTDPNETIIQEIKIHGSAERIFEALANPEQRMRWWGIKGRFQVTEVNSDLRPGGKWSMRGTGFGKPFTVQGEYRQIEPPRLLSFTWLPEWQGDPTVSLVRFDLKEDAGATTVRLTHSGLTTELSRSSHRGWPQLLALLRDYVEGVQREPLRAEAAAKSPKRELAAK